VALAQVQLFLVLWTLVVSALEYAVQGFSTEVQQPRFVGDGAIFSSESKVRVPCPRLMVL
jgi:hypothetical protein